MARCSAEKGLTMTCDHCGSCCQRFPCSLPFRYGGPELFGAPCWFLFPAGGRWWCRMIYYERMYSDYQPFSNRIGVGMGCATSPISEAISVKMSRFAMRLKKP